MNRGGNVTMTVRGVNGMVVAVAIGCGLLLGACSAGNGLEAGKCITDPFDELMEDPMNTQPEIESVACGSSAAELKLVEEVGPMSLEDTGPECPEGSRPEAIAVQVDENRFERWCVEEVS